MDKPLIHIQNTSKVYEPEKYIPSKPQRHLISAIDVILKQQPKEGGRMVEVSWHVSCRVVLHVKDGALKLQSNMFVVVVEFIFFFIVVVFVGSCWMVCWFSQLPSRKYWFYCHGKLERVLILFGRDYIHNLLFFRGPIVLWDFNAQILLMRRLDKPFSDGKTMHFYEVVKKYMNHTL